MKEFVSSRWENLPCLALGLFPDVVMGKWGCWLPPALTLSPSFLQIQTSKPCLG